MIYLWMFRPVYCLRKRIHRSGTEHGIGDLFFGMVILAAPTLLHHVVNWR